MDRPDIDAIRLYFMARWFVNFDRKLANELCDYIEQLEAARPTREQIELAVALGHYNAGRPAVSGDIALHVTAAVMALLDGNTE